MRFMAHLVSILSIDTLNTLDSAYNSKGLQKWNGLSSAKWIATDTYSSRKYFKNT